MPEFLEDPSVLTKDKLKSELVANNVTLPAGEQRKDVYVQLYLQHLTARNRPPLGAGANSKGPPDFSSDEEREPTPVLGSGSVAGRGRAAVGRVRPLGGGLGGGGNDRRGRAFDGRGACSAAGPDPRGVAVVTEAAGRGGERAGDKPLGCSAGPAPGPLRAPEPV